MGQVYQHLVFDGREHKSLRTFPGMADRCVTIGSAGKTFSFTGWKVAPLSWSRPKGHPMLPGPFHLHQAAGLTSAVDMLMMKAYVHASGQQL